MNATDIQVILEKHMLWLEDHLTGERANLRGADLRGVDLRDADLTEANLRGATLIGATLIGATLIGATLPWANLTGADLTGADLTRADLYGSDLTRAYLTGAALTEADLRGANLAGADLRGASLFRADLRGADLTGADLRFANLTMADLTGATMPSELAKPSDPNWQDPKTLGIEIPFVEPGEAAVVIEASLVTEDVRVEFVVYQRVLQSITTTVMVPKHVVDDGLAQVEAWVAQNERLWSTPTNIKTASTETQMDAVFVTRYN
jgi:hypothetical protein